MAPDLKVLEDRIGYTFRDKSLLVRALTHKSLAFDRRPLSASNSGPGEDNEQFEFLGDAILGFIVSEALVRNSPGLAEGRLSKTKAHLVSATHLYEAAVRLGLGEFLQLGRGEEMSGGRTKKALLANAFEAILAAMYQDGGLEPARKLIEDQILAGATPVDTNGSEQITDFKTALQERVQALSLPQPRYLIVGEHGPEHAKQFTIEVRVGNKHATQGQGSSKKAAGQAAAELMLRRLDNAAGA